MALSRRHAATRAWSPESRTSGTPIPLKLAGRVYWAYSSSPEGEKDSSTALISSPSAPGRSRATASMTVSAASSPPVRT